MKFRCLNGTPKKNTDGAGLFEKKSHFGYTVMPKNTQKVGFFGF